MQLLTFTAAGRRYGIETPRVVEVLPLIAARPLPKQSNEVRGLIRYRGRMLPALDLSQLISEVRCRDRLGTRTIIVRLATPPCWASSPKMWSALPRLSRPLRHPQKQTASSAP